MTVPATAAPATKTPGTTSSTDAQATTPAPANGARRPGPARTSQPHDAMVLPQVQIKGNDETEARRQSTAAKIVIGRAEIELYGDTTMGELLKRMPGITVQGRPGRGDAPRMRGLGNGYTQILIDGESVPRGFSLDDLSPEEIERIEILRAPTAEIGARDCRHHQHHHARWLRAVDHQPQLPVAHVGQQLCRARLRDRRQPVVHQPTGANPARNHADHQPVVRKPAGPVGDQTVGV